MATKLYTEATIFFRGDPQGLTYALYEAVPETSILANISEVNKDRMLSLIVKSGDTDGRIVLAIAVSEIKVILFG